MPGKPLRLRLFAFSHRLAGPPALVETVDVVRRVRPGPIEFRDRFLGVAEHEQSIAAVDVRFGGERRRLHIVLRHALR